MTWYKDGTLAIGANDTTVTGTGVAWETALVEAGDALVVTGFDPVEILSVTDQLHLELAAPWTGAAQSGATYSIAPIAPRHTTTGRLTDRVRALMDALEATLTPVRLAVGGVFDAGDAVTTFLSRGSQHIFDSEGAGVSVLVNKAATSDLGAVEFQAAGVPKCRIGLIGTDGLRGQVFLNGVSWFDFLQIDPATGAVSFPANNFPSPVNAVVLTGSGTYTPTPGAVMMKVTAVGGGGGGAGGETSSAAHFVGCGGGGGGATAVGWFDILEENYAFSVGAGGAGGSAGVGDPVGSRDGVNGGDTTFSGGVVDLNARGGMGAPEDAEATGANEFVGGVGGVATGGALNINGGRGGGGVTDGSTFYQIGLGIGGASTLGAGGTVRNGSGFGGAGFGSGGGGAGMLPGYVLNRSGGAGRLGTIIVEEHFGAGL